MSEVVEKEAELLEAIEKLELQEEVKEELKIDNQTALSRFIFTRSLEPNFTCDNRASGAESLYELLKISDHLKALADKDPQIIFTLLQKAIQSNCLWSNKESLFCLAFCLRVLKNEALSIEIRKNFVQLVPDLLTFLFFYKSIGENNNLTFNRGMRNCLQHWYETKSPSELLELIFATQKFGEISHREILTKLRLKFENEDKNEIISLMFSDYEKIKELAEKSTTAKKVLQYRNLKRCKEPHEAASILKRKDFTYKLEHLPSFGLKSAELFELVLPNLSLSEVIFTLPDLDSKKLLKEATSRKICNALQSSNKTIHAAKLNPLEVFGVIKRLQLFEIKKEEAAADEEKKEKKSPNAFVVQKLKNIFTQTLNDQPKTGCKFFVTVDFRKFSKRQNEVFGMKNVKCSEVQAILALTLLKNEKDVTVMSFSDSKHKLKPVAWTAETSFEKAMEIYEKEIKENPKTKENISLPLRKASEDKKKVDVFITFVSSVARTLGKNGKPPLKELKNYRKALNLKMTKLVIINLTRKKPDLKYDNSDINEKGILEVSGFNPDAMKVIEAFAKNCFA